MLSQHPAYTQNDDSSPLLLASLPVWYLICNLDLLPWSMIPLVAAQGSCAFRAVVAIIMYGALAFIAPPVEQQALYLSLADERTQ